MREVEGVGGGEGEGCSKIVIQSALKNQASYSSVKSETSECTTHTQKIKKRKKKGYI